MATKRDIELASLFFRSGILNQEEIQTVLAQQGKLLTQGKVASLVELLVERGLIPVDAAPTFTDEPLERLQPLPDYDLLEFVGDGASARVYRGVHKPTGRDVAVKVLHPEQELMVKALKRFLREAQLLCKLGHRSIVKGYEVRKVNGFRYVAMEWVDGGTVLEEIDRRGRLDGANALHITRQIASALQYLHENGIIHRDIKPGNVLIDTAWNAKLIDLGLCLLVGQAREEAEGTTVGTVGYISPEQAKGTDVDERSDIYSLGVTLYHMVVGEVPFSGDDDFEVMSKQIMQSLKSDKLKSLNISPHVHYAIQKMMAKEKEIRYQRMVDVVTDLDAYLKSTGYEAIPFARPARETARAETRTPSGRTAPAPKPVGKKPEAPISKRRRRFR
ncbi:MAG TPA: serine/threonine-protein kinase [Planctomycetota bacterium]|nr:serine/threonine-protein kinase [Planctomycetota bacterium]